MCAIYSSAGAASYPYLRVDRLTVHRAIAGIWFPRSSQFAAPASLPTRTCCGQGTHQTKPKQSGFKSQIVTLKRGQNVKYLPYHNAPLALGSVHLLTREMH